MKLIKSISLPTICRLKIRILHFTVLEDWYIA